MLFSRKRPADDSLCGVSITQNPQQFYGEVVTIAETDYLYMLSRISRLTNQRDAYRRKYERQQEHTDRLVEKMRQRRADIWYMHKKLVALRPLLNHVGQFITTLGEIVDC